jgi:hypothetical protein
MIADPWPSDETARGCGVLGPGGWPALPALSPMTPHPCSELSSASVGPSPGSPGVLLGLAVLDTLPLCVLLVRIGSDPSPLPRLDAPSGW